jgi:hypothetical protein
MRLLHLALGKWSNLQAFFWLTWTVSEGSRHVVRYFSAWEEEERLFIQTELCGDTLEALVRAACGTLLSM